MGRKRLNDSGANGSDGDTPETTATAAPEDNGEAKPVESKADRFRRLANKRLAKAEKAIAQIRNLGNRSQYEYTDEQRDIVLNVLIRAFERVKDAYCPPDNTSGGEANYV